MFTAALAVVESHNNNSSNRYYTYLQTIEDNNRIQTYMIIIPIYRP